MTSQIDSTKPIVGAPTTQSVRDNFSTAALEITDLQVKTTGAPFLPLAGQTMTGPLYLDRDPTSPNQAVTKAYADAGAGSGGGGLPEAPTDGTLYARQDGAWLHAVNTGELNAAITARLVPASETVSGIAMLATTALVTAGTDNTTTVTPAKLQAKINTFGSAFLPIGGGILTGVLGIYPAAANTNAVLTLRRSGAANTNGIIGLDETGATRWNLTLGEGQDANAFKLYRVNGAATAYALQINNTSGVWTLENGIYFGVTSSADGAALIAGRSSALTGASDFLQVAARYLPTPVGGQFGDGGVLTCFGTNHSGQPGAVTINAGSRATQYRTWNFSTTGMMTTPGAVVIGAVAGGSPVVAGAATSNGDVFVVGRFSGGGGGQINLYGPQGGLPSGMQLYAGATGAQQAWNFSGDGTLRTPGPIFIGPYGASGPANLYGATYATGYNDYLGILRNENGQGATIILTGANYTGSPNFIAFSTGASGQNKFYFQNDGGSDFPQVVRAPRFGGGEAGQGILRVVGNTADLSFAWDTSGGTPGMGVRVDTTHRGFLPYSIQFYLLSWQSNTMVGSIWPATSGVYPIFTPSGYSDDNLKSNVAPTTVDALEALAALEVVAFDWTAEGLQMSDLDEADAHVPIGFTYSNVKVVIPEAAKLVKLPDGATREEVGIVINERVVPYLVRANQQSQTAMAALADRIAALEAKP